MPAAMKAMMRFLRDRSRAARRPSSWIAIDFDRRSFCEGRSLSWLECFRVGAPSAGPDTDTPNGVCPVRPGSSGAGQDKSGTLSRLSGLSAVTLLFPLG